MLDAKLLKPLNMVRNWVALISWLQLKFVFVFLALKCLKIQTFRDYCPFISGRCRYTERASFYSNVATFEARAGRVRSNKIEVNVNVARLRVLHLKIRRPSALRLSLVLWRPARTTATIISPAVWPGEEKCFAVAIWPVTGQGFQNTKWPADGSSIFSVNFTKSKDSS